MEKGLDTKGQVSNQPEQTAPHVWSERSWLVKVLWGRRGGRRGQEREMSPGGGTRAHSPNNLHHSTLCTERAVCLEKVGSWLLGEPSSRT